MFLPRFTQALTAGAAALLLAACPGQQDAAAAKPKSPPPVAVTTAMSVRKNIPIDQRAIGNVEPIATVAIKAQVSGELIDVSFEEGQEVKKGHLLFTIQPKLYETQLAQAKANLARDKAMAASAQRDYKRQQELDAKGAGIKEELEKAKAQAEAAEATVQGDVALETIAQTQKDYTTIESPMDGRTGAIRVRKGNLIRATSDEPMTTVVQLAPIYVAFHVPEQYLAKIRDGITKRTIKATANDPRSNRNLGEGELKFIDNTVDPTTGTILLKAEFTNEDHALWPGAFIDVILHLDEEKDVVVVPAPAVTWGQKGAQIYVIKADGTADLRLVKTGRTVNQETAVLEGLKENEKVVTLGQAQMLPGSKVIDKTPPPAGDKASPDGAKPAAKGSEAKPEKGAGE